VHENIYEQYNKFIFYRVGHKFVTYFTSVLWVTVWSGESKFCVHIYVFVCSLVVMENWLVNCCIFALRTYFETKSIVQIQRQFWHEFDIPKHGRIPSLNAI
jgi:hypothetical protein